MRAEAEFPLRQWEKVTGVNIYLGGMIVEPDCLDGVLEDFRLRYGDALASYLCMLLRQEGTEVESMNSLRPYFPKKGETSYLLPGSCRVLHVYRCGKSMELCMDTGKRRGFWGYLGFHDTEKVAEVRCQTIHQQKPKFDQRVFRRL